MCVPRSVPVGIAVAGVGMVISGFVATDPGAANSMREAVHSQASGLASVALVATALLWLTLGRRRSPRGWEPSVTAVAFAAAATVLAAVSPWLHRSTWTGLSQRALWVALLGWLFAVAWSPAIGVSRPRQRRRQYRLRGSTGRQRRHR